MEPIIVDTPDGGTAEFPAGTSPETIKAALAKRFPKPAAASPSPVGQALRGAGRMHDLFTQGARDAVLDTAGIPVDAVSWLARQAGAPVAAEPLGGSASLKRGADFLATLPGRVVDAVDQGSVQPFLEDRTSRVIPQGDEKWLYGAGRGAGGVAAIAGPAATLARTTAGYAPTLTQRVAGAMATQPGTQLVAGGIGGAVAEGTGDPWAGLAAGVAAGGAPAVARRAITPRNMLTIEEQRLAQAAVNEGIPLTLGQQSGSRGVQLAESQLRKLPFSGNAAQRQFDEQRQAFNRAVLQRANIQADRAAPEVIDRAFDDVGAIYNDLIRRTGPIPVDADFARDVVGVVQNYGRRLTTDVAPVFNSYIQDLAPAFQALARGGNPQIDAGIYQNIRSDIGRRARAAASNPPLRDALYALQGTLDDAVTRANPAMAPEWDEARRIYHNLLMIDTAMARAPQGDAITGNIPFGAFRQAVRSSDAGGYARGRGELNELSRVGSFLADRIPDSGTSQRTFMTGLLTGGAAGSMNPFMIGGIAAAPVVQAGMRAAAPNYLARLNNPRPAPTSVNMLNDLFIRRLEGEGR